VSSRADRGVVRKGVTTVLVRPTPRGRVLLVGLVAATAVGLAGCNSTADETPSPTEVPRSSEPSSPSSPSPSAGPSPTETSSIPAAAREQTPEGAEAFVKYFVGAFNDAWTQPQPGLIAELSVAKCQFCSKTEETARTLSSRGERYDSAPLTLQTAEAFSGAPPNQQFVYAELVQNEASVVDGSGEKVHQDDRQSLPSNIALLWDRDHWVVYELEEA
jgi:hypothetical protein